MIKRVDSGGQVKLVTNVRRPRKWRRYEYLLSSGTLYIDTGIYGYMNHTYEITYQLVSIVTNCKVWGTRGKDTYSGLNMSVTYSSDGSLILYWISATSGTNNVSLGTINTNKHVLLVENGHVHFDGVDKGTSTGHNSSFSILNNIYLFGFNSNGTPRSTSSKIYEYKDYDVSGTLLLHLVPAQYNGEYGMWDLVEDKFYGNAGTGSFTVGPEVKNYDEIDEVRRTSSILPAGIELYDYIEGNGTSTYLDTGINPQVKPRVVADLTFVNSADKDYWGNSAIPGSAYYASFSQYLLKFYRFGSTTSIDCGNAVSVNTRHIYDVSNNVYLDGTLIKTTTNTYTYNSSQSNILIFKAARSNYYSDYKLHDFKLYDGDTLVRHLLPCTYLGEPGMWDTVENKFYRNLGTGLFILGNKITLKEYEYLLSTDTLYINTGVDGILRATLDVQCTSTSSASRIILGTGADGALLWFGQNTNKYAIGANNEFRSIESDTTRIVVSLMSSATLMTMTINGNTITRNASRTTNTVWNLFRGGTNSYYALCKIFYAKFYDDNSSLIRDFIPCSYNGEYGLWDKVEWKFYPNAGTGSFTLGPEKASGIYPVRRTFNDESLFTFRLTAGNANVMRNVVLLNGIKGKSVDTDSVSPTLQLKYTL